MKRERQGETERWREISNEIMKDNGESQGEEKRGKERRREE